MELFLFGEKGGEGLVDGEMSLFVLIMWVGGLVGIYFFFVYVSFKLIIKRMVKI